MNKLYLRTVEYDAYNKKGDSMIIDRNTWLHYGEIPEMESNELHLIICMTITVINVLEEELKVIIVGELT